MSSCRSRRPGVDAAKLLGGDSPGGRNRLLGEVMDEAEVHLLHGFAQGIPEDFQPLVEQRHRHHVPAGSNRKWHASISSRRLNR
jgi:hypothetical protein